MREYASHACDYSTELGTGPLGRTSQPVAGRAPVPPPPPSRADYASAYDTDPADCAYQPWP
jgi:hypothetical protein